MAEVGIRALKQNASAVVAEVVAGEIVTITDRGRPVAQMTPLSSDTVEDMITSGRARPPLRHLSDLPAPKRRRRDQPSLSAELEDMRQAERY